MARLQGGGGPSLSTAGATSGVHTFSAKPGNSTAASKMFTQARSATGFCMTVRKPLVEKQLVSMITPEAPPTGDRSWNTNGPRRLWPAGLGTDPPPRAPLGPGETRPGQVQRRGWIKDLRRVMQKAVTLRVGVGRPLFRIRGLADYTAKQLHCPAAQGVREARRVRVLAAPHRLRHSGSSGHALRHPLGADDQARL